jgi:hypothetical protein
MSKKTAVGNNTHSTSLVTGETPLSPRQHQHEAIFKKRVASIDLRIGLNLLGEKGRMLLAEYIQTKTSHPAC